MVKWSRISEISAYKRADAHLIRRTTHGAIVTVLGVILGITLAAHEISWYAMGKGTSKMAVDLARRHDLNIHVDISFPAIPCAGLSVDIMDASGTAGNDASHAKGVQLHKLRLDPRGKRITGKDGEYQTPQSQKLVQDKSGTVMQIDLGAAMSQMSDMDSELQHHEGCRVYGDISVRRVAGRLHFAVHQQSFIDVLPQMLTGHVLPKLTNMSHIIHKVAFGPEFPGQVNPLDGFNRINGPGEVAKAFKYFLKIVPTEYYTRMGVVLETSQYSVGEFAMPLHGPVGPAPKPAEVDGDGNKHKLAQVTGAGPMGAGAGDSHPTSTVQNAFVDFSYDLSPIVMTINANPGSLLHFIVRLCAVVGGVMSVTRMVDKIVHAVLVGTGVVVMKQTSTKGLQRGSSMGSYSSGYSSARNSMPGDATAYVSGSPVAASYGSASYPARSSSGGDTLLPGTHLRERTVGSFPGTVGSHPLSRFNSSGAGSFSQGGAPVSGGGATNGLHTAASGGIGSYGGAAYGGLHSSSSLGGSGMYVGDAIPRTAGMSGGGAHSSGGAPAAAGLTPTASGQVTSLLHLGNSGFAGANALASAGSMQRASSGGYGSSGGAPAAPGAYLQQGASRFGPQHSVGR